MRALGFGLITGAADDVVWGFSTMAMLLLIMLLTNNRTVMGKQG